MYIQVVHIERSHLALTPNAYNVYVFFIENYCVIICKEDQIKYDMQQKRQSFYT